MIKWPFYSLNNMLIALNSVHVYSANLTLAADEENKHFNVLSAEEKSRANQFYFPLHRSRYIAARGILRHLISLYTNISPQDIELGSNQYKKPYLIHSEFSALQFNLAHSDDLAVYAFTLSHAIGIDVEKIRDTYNTSVAKRYFSQKENEELNALSHEEQSTAFYKLWARKEAFVKAVGKGLKIPLSSFSVSASNTFESIQFENQVWSLLSIPLHPDFQVALATNQIIQTISCWHYSNNNLTLTSVNKIEGL